jgi:hypothetical protein
LVPGNQHRIPPRYLKLDHYNSPCSNCTTGPQQCLTPRRASQKEDRGASCTPQPNMHQQYAAAGHLGATSGKCCSQRLPPQASVATPEPGLQQHAPASASRVRRMQSQCMPPPAPGVQLHSCCVKLSRGRSTSHSHGSNAGRKPADLQPFVSSTLNSGVWHCRGHCSLPPPGAVLAGDGQLMCSFECKQSPQNSLYCHNM